MAQNRRHKFTGGGVLLSNLFHDYPESSLKFIHRDQPYNLGERHGEYRVSWFWVRFNIASIISNLYRLIRLSITDRTLFGIVDLKSIVQQSSYFSPPAAVMNEIKLFQPEVVYAWASDVFWTKSIAELASNLNSPHVIHFMDNHIDRVTSTNCERVIFPEFLTRIYALTHNSRRVLAISDSMAAAYSKLFECSVDVFRGAIDASEWPKPTKGLFLKKHLKIGYVGSIEKSQIQSLLDLMDVVEDLNKTSTCQIEVILYLANSYKESVREKIIDRQFVSIVDHPCFSDLSQVLGELDLLFSFYGFGDDSISYYKYSFATKIVPYMLSGTPILIYGPPEIEPVNYAREGGWSILVDTRSRQLLGTAIQEFINHPQAKQSMVLRAWECAVKNHNLKSNALRFQSVMVDVALNKPNPV